VFQKNTADEFANQPLKEQILLTEAETVTLLNDLCIFALGSLVNKRLAWGKIDSLSAKVKLTNGMYAVSAILYFNKTGELINFMSDDRSAAQDDDTMKPVRWTTPVPVYKEFDGGKSQRLAVPFVITPKVILPTAFSP
jgi:hypothetical protein